MSPDTNPSPESSQSTLIPSETISVSETVNEAPIDTHEGENRLLDFVNNDPIFRDMLKVVEREKIRLRLSIRYTLLMFGIFLVFAWIVSNRVIMFGFAEFVWLSRIRDGLFGIMA